MAILSDTDRTRIWRGIMRYWSRLEETIPISSVELRDAINATDQWIDDNQTSFNNALPNSAKTNLTLTQKTVLFCIVAAMRVSPALARAIIGEVD